ncbi:unnamed protein product [Rotaria magnacalcarata]|uniref:G-protein coupled receptors family 1 profile domain-containing protein n=1 Tax=Rotaria magnacalcarata TaxID=392030 RepID=A0A816QJ67_9BILA|nr:unnamed protein product [Rotaria magnacalcarata]CAF4057168.1 unnamed protein product [Rotaria magnacalcarata]
MVFSTRTMAIWLITLATIDRWLISSVRVHHRQMSTLKNAKRAIFIIVILSSISYSYMLYCDEANITDAPLQCYEKLEGYRLVTDLAYVLVTILIPFSLMITFGALTVANIRHLQNRLLHAANDENNSDRSAHANVKSKKIDRHLLRMLILQVSLLIILCISQAIQKLYMALGPLGSGSESDDAMKIFLYNIELLLAFIASGMPFYLNTLVGGSIFRNASLNLLQSFKQNMTFLYN